MMTARYVRTGAVYRAHTLHHALVQPHLDKNTALCSQLAEEIEKLEQRLMELERFSEELDYALIQTYREMLHARKNLYMELAP